MISAVVSLARAVIVGLACLALVSVVAPPGSASGPAQRGQSGDRPYLALGDSVPFGFDPLDNSGDASNFAGYPAGVQRRLGYDLTNATCPGEASGGFVSPAGVDNGCRHYHSANPLHAGYDSTQLDYAVEFLEAHPRTALVTLTLGANDLFACRKQPGGCTPKALARTLHRFRVNLDDIYSAIRDVYHHRLVALTYYTSDYRDPRAVAAMRAVNRVLASVTREYGGTVASGFQAFKTIASRSGGDSCAAGLLIELPDGTCDIHPSPQGTRVLVAAVVDAVRPRPGSPSSIPPTPTEIVWSLVLGR